MFEKDLSLSLYYDTYQSLLSDKKREVFEKYYLDDLSLSEIAEETGTSRQAVRDLIARAQESLYDYEKALHLIEKKKRLGEIADSIKNGTENTDLLCEELKEIL